MGIEPILELHKVAKSRSGRSTCRL